MERNAHGEQRVQHRPLSTQRAQHVPSAAPMLSAGQCAAPRRAVRIWATALPCRSICGHGRFRTTLGVHVHHSPVSLR